MKTTFTNGREAFEKVEPNYGMTGLVVPYGHGFVNFSKVYGLHHSTELPTPTALTAYAYVMTARDWTFFKFEWDALIKEANKHAPRSTPMEGFETPSVSKFDKPKAKRDSLAIRVRHKLHCLWGKRDPSMASSQSQR